MEYEVGKYYNVRCAKMVQGDKFYYVAVIGEVHNDNQFGFGEKHLHIDGRFVGRQEMSRLSISKDGFTNNVCTFDNETSAFVIVKIVIQRRKCKRLTTGLMPPSRTAKNFITGKPKAEKYWAWYDSMVGKSCKGKRCPHLGTVMHEADGKLVCPLHNLVGDKETEVIINA